ncbi:1-aminocyclopropane-1-carboxylate oxidase homolog 1-like [Aristolochia californica]|uniref:1-aminocyclopropane-1-carboxylate oxidase homolog 1-like n=1 Tax=Aristolochia californica TaxID=171875 RepID=UPI0035D56D67
MAVAGAAEIPSEIPPSYDRLREMKSFDETKLGVKGLVDAGVTNIPRFFILPSEDLRNNHAPSPVQKGIPIVDLDRVGQEDRRKEIVKEIRGVLETWGFFQVINHGIPQRVLDEMIQRVKRFNEESEEKVAFYSRDPDKRVKFVSNFDLYQSKAANWRDTLSCLMAPNFEDPEELPEICRDILMEYSEYMKRVGDTIFALLSEVLGLGPKYFDDMGCMDGHVLLSHYYPACPEPEITIGTSKHSDSGFLTLLLQDEIGGLQVLHQDREWVDVPPVRGALVVNIADLLQLVTNDKFKSVVHRVKAQKVGPRISIACFFTTHTYPSNKLFGPIKELLSEENPPKYREVTTRDYLMHYYALGLGGEPALNHFRL